MPSLEWTLPANARKDEVRMYSVNEISFGDARRILRYKQEGVYGAAFNIKGFDYAWLVAARQWKQGERVLDVGAGYSNLPMHLHETYGCDTWVADDYGMESEEAFWTRGKRPRQHVENHPEIHFALERLGDPAASSLDPGSFDVIVSASALEHVPPPLVEDVWRHMDLLLKPGGEMLHAIDLKLPTHRGMLSVMKGLALDLASPLVPASYRLENVFFTPRTYLKAVSRALPVRFSDLPRNFSIPSLVLDPTIVLEPLDWAYNRMREGSSDVPIMRVATLLIHLTKAD